MPKFKKNPNPHIFMDISIGGRAAERITFELFANVVPRTAENFRALCTGERGLGESTKKPLYFKGTHIHRIIPGFMAQGGDFSTGDGRGGESIYGGKFPDENFKLKHDQPGILSMANSGKNTNGSQFFITLKATPHLDGKHVVFGKVLDGKALLKKLEAVGTDSGKPTSPVKIVDCGEASNTDTQNQLHGEKEKKLKKAVEDNSDSEGKVKTKKLSSEDKQKKKRKHYSSDSYSSETSDSRSYSSDSGSGSESYSSASLDTSSSSDHRHKRRKGSKKVKRKSTKRKSSHKKSKSNSKGTKRKSKRSYGSSSDDSESSSSSSENESAGRHTKHSLKKAQLICTSQQHGSHGGDLVYMEEIMMEALAESCGGRDKRQRLLATPLFEESRQQINPTRISVVVGGQGRRSRRAAGRAGRGGARRRGEVARVEGGWPGRPMRSTGQHGSEMWWLSGVEEDDACC